MTEQAYEFDNSSVHPIKTWTKGVPVAENARQQMRLVATLPFIHRHVAGMPDMHLGKGATVGSVVATRKALVPSVTGVN